MYKNNIRTRKKKELFWIPHAKLITSFLFVATVIFLILMYINYMLTSQKINSRYV